MIHTFTTPEQRDIDEMTPDEQRRLFERIFDDESSFGVVFDANNEEVSAEKLFGGRRKRRRQNGAYLTCGRIAELTGWSEDAIHRRFLHTTGVDKRTFAGRNRKTYTVLRIPRSVVKRVFPELEEELKQ